MKYIREHPWVFGALVAMFFVGLVAVRTISEARSELVAADADALEGDSMRALQHYRRAMRWSFPGSPYAPSAARSLRSMAKELEGEGRVDHALLAWRSIAGSSAATRFIYSVSDPTREEANREIARLMAAGQPPGIDIGLTTSELEAAHRALLDEEISPSPLWGTLLLVGFAAWVGGLVVVASRGFDSAGRLQWTTARAPLSGALAGFVAFVLGMLFT